MAKIFGHFDIEADGPTPMTSNMINIGVVFTDNLGKILHEVSIDISPRKGYNGDKDTLNWWMNDAKRKTEYERILREGIDHITAMDRLNDALIHVMETTGVKKIYWVARPAAYDWMFLKCYHDLYISDKFSKNKIVIPIGFSATCLSSIREVWMLFKNIKREQVDDYIKEKWTKDLVMTHNGLDDARYQARIYHGMMAELEGYSR